ncbi:MAG: pyridoxal phosphate-dependent aminotransferase [Candidatus Nanohaloarchaeota archaeon QJJ-7]|nr:pyridoxal phosphate-dependent aminotransferase [Candidatus Nanohaloarchaeota archaeon QJJ-7]
MVMGIRESVRDAVFSIRDISEKAGRMDDTVRLDIGQPDFETPSEVKKAASEAIREDHITYTSLWGIPELRKEAADYESWKTEMGEKNIMVTTGGIGALHCILTGFLEPGENVVMNDPAWMPYSLISRVSPGTFGQVPYFDEDGEVRASAIRDSIGEDTELLLLNSPENPTGRVYTEEQVKTLGELAEEEGLWIVSDEVYDHLLYGDAEHVSAAEHFPDRTLIVNSMSKNFAMTGWRIGWVASRDEEMIHELGKVNRASTACPNYIGQKAALTALKESQDYVNDMREEFEDRQELVLQHVEDLGWDSVNPEGAIYAFPDVEQDSWEFAHSLLENEGVAVVPGSAAGGSGDTNVRICFGSATQEDIEEGFQRIKRFVG